MRVTKAMLQLEVNRLVTERDFLHEDNDLLRVKIATAEERHRGLTQVIVRCRRTLDACQGVFRVCELNEQEHRATNIGSYRLLGLPDLMADLDGITKDSVKPCPS